MLTAEHLAELDRVIEEAHQYESDLPLYDAACDLRRAYKQLAARVSTPHTGEFVESVALEAAHQIERWGVEHDAGKRREDWITLVTYLLGKIALAHFDRDDEKLKHRIVATCAALLNWYRAETDDTREMRPGIAP